MTIIDPEAMPWSCRVTIGDQVYEVAHDPDEIHDATATPVVVDDLSFGWSMPSGAWPEQPGAMDANLALTGSFAALEEIRVGDAIGIQVWLDEAGPLSASFHGRVTDATSRPVASDSETGVTIDVVAVDHSVDIAEYADLGYSLPAGFGTLGEHNMAQIALLAGGATMLPGPVISSYPPILDLYPNWAMHDTDTPLDTIAAPTQLLTDLLRQMIRADLGARLVYAPLLDADGVKIAGRWLTYDQVTRDATSSDPDLTLDGDQLDIALTWSQTKGAIAASVAVNYAASGPGGAASAATAGDPTAYNTQHLTVRLGTGAVARATEIASFYYHGTDYDAWQVKEVTVLLDQVDATFPADQFFPDHTAPEGDPTRAACYGLAVALENIEASIDPYAGTRGITGTVVAARLRIADGLPALSLGLRYCRPHP